MVDLSGLIPAGNREQPAQDAKIVRKVVRGDRQPP